MYYYRRNRNPYNWQDMARLQQQMSRFFDEQLPARYAWGGNYPVMNVYTSSEDAVVTAELPGVAADELEISVVGETLTISGERKAEAMGEDTTCHRNERASGKFNRSIELPFPVETNKVEARMDKGLLTIRLPRAEEDKPRRINVKS
jgi:HSP20 family protein